MATIQTQPTTANVQDFISKIPNETQRKDCQILLDLMEKISKEKPVMWGKSLVGFGEETLKYASGRDVRWLKIGFAPRSKAISLYLTCNLDQYEDQLKKLGKHTRGMGCLYIKTLRDVDMEQLKILIETAFKTSQKK